MSSSESDLPPLTPAPRRLLAPVTPRSAAADELDRALAAALLLDDDEDEDGSARARARRGSVLSAGAEVSGVARLEASRVVGGGASADAGEDDHHLFGAAAPLTRSSRASTVSLDSIANDDVPQTPGREAARPPSPAREPALLVLPPAPTAATPAAKQVPQASPSPSAAPRNSVRSLRKRRVPSEGRLRRAPSAPRLRLPPLERTPAPLDIEQWHSALASLANERQAKQASELAAAAGAAALREAEVVLVRAAAERNAAAAERVAHERNMAFMLFQQVPRPAAAAAAASAASAAGASFRGGGSSTPAAQPRSASPPKGSPTNRRTAMSASTARALLTPLCPTAAPEFDATAAKGDAAFEKHMARAGLEDLQTALRLLRVHIFLCCRLGRGEQWFPSGVEPATGAMSLGGVGAGAGAGHGRSGDDSSSVNGVAGAGPLGLSVRSPVDVAKDVSKIVGNHGIGAKAAAFRELYRLMYEGVAASDKPGASSPVVPSVIASALMQGSTPTPRALQKPLVPRSTLEAAIGDLRSYAILLSRGLLLKYPFLTAVPVRADPLPATLTSSATPDRRPQAASPPSQQQNQRQQQQQRELVERPKSLARPASLISLLQKSAPSLFGPLQASPPPPPPSKAIAAIRAGAESSAASFAGAGAASTAAANNHQHQKQQRIVLTDFGPAVLRTAHEALSILCYDTLFGVISAHTRALDDEAAPAFARIGELPPCAFGLSHAFCSPGEPGCTASAGDAIEPAAAAAAAAAAPPGRMPAAAAGDECYRSAIECLAFVQHQRSPLSKLGAVRNCLKAITHGAQLERRLEASLAGDAAAGSGDMSPSAAARPGDEGDVSPGAPLSPRAGVTPSNSRAQSRGAPSSIGADDLMPRLCFVLARACLLCASSGAAASGAAASGAAASGAAACGGGAFRAFAEVCFLEECTPEDRLLGEDGYVLVSLRGALMHVLVLARSLVSPESPQ